MRKPDGAARASILLLAVWFLFMLSMFAVILGHQVRQKLSLVKRLQDRARLRLVFDAAAKKAGAHLKQSIGAEYMSLSDSWSNSPVFNEVMVGQDRFSLAYNLDATYGMNAQEQKRFGMIDEERKLNINSAAPETLKRLFIILGIPDMEAQDLAFSIADWRDEDSMLSNPTGSAEDSYYRSLNPAYEAKDGPFEVLSELLLVKGCTPEIFQKAAGYLTVFGSGKVNINTVSAVVLQALGLSPEIADKVIAYRNGKDNLVGSGDDVAFASVSEVPNRVAEAYGLNTSQQLQLQSVCDSQALSTKSQNFTCAVTAMLAGSPRTYTAACVLSLRGRIWYWQEQ